MGLWGWVKSTTRKAVEKVKDAGRAIKEKVTNVWNKFSGKDNFDEADRLYQEISERYKRKSEEFHREVDAITAQIEKYVQSINTNKRHIKSELFVKMATNMSKIKDVSINQAFTLDSYAVKDTSFDSVRSRDKLFLIDFNRHKIKTNTLAVITLGFWTRKKAKETLYAVQEEEKKLEVEMKKMDAELQKLKAIEISLKSVDQYFSDLIGVYEQLLVRLDSSVKFLYFRSLRFAHKLLHKEMSIKYLTKVQQGEIEAIVTASIILKKMVETQVVAVDDKVSVSRYQKDLEQQHTEICKVYEVA